MPRRKKRAAWASITEVERGSVYRIRFWATGPDGYRRRSKTVRGTRLEAERARSELMLAHSEDAPCPTVGEVWRSYVLPDLKRRVEGGEIAPASRDAYERGWRLHCEPMWGAVQCDAVRPLAVQQWLYDMDLTAARMGKRALVLVLDYAVRYELVGHNVGRERYVMPSRATIRTRDKGVWTLEELGEVWQALHGEWFEAAFLLAGFGGLRVAESMAVTSADVDELGGCAIVGVRRQIARTGEVTDRLKTPQSMRVVAVPGRAGRRIVQLAESCETWLSGDGLGGHSSHTRLLSAWAALDVRDGLRHPFANLRNSWQTNMRWVLRIPPMFIEPMMGHRVAGVTGAHYDRPSAEMFAEVMAEAYAERPYDAGWNWLD